MKLINAMAAENIKSVSQYVGWLFRANLSALPRIVALYVAMVRRILARSGDHSWSAEDAVRAKHQHRVSAFEAESGMPQGTAEQIDAMHAPPVMRNRIATARFLALDLWAAGFAFAGAAVVVLAMFSATIAVLAALGALGLIGLLIYMGSIRLAGMTEAADLHKTAERVAELLGVRNVVFGHSHGAGSWPIKGGSTYLNVGTWVPVEESSYFVYAVLEAHDRQARLMRWNKESDEPDVLGREQDAAEPFAHGRAA
jgi:hypothetical protein